MSAWPEMQEMREEIADRVKAHQDRKARTTHAIKRLRQITDLSHQSAPPEKHDKDLDEIRRLAFEAIRLLEEKRS